MEDTKELQCDGNCIETHGEHSGRVRLVAVTSPTFQSEWSFNYCDNAISEDKERGFLITEV